MDLPSPLPSAAIPAAAAPLPSAGHDADAPPSSLPLPPWEQHGGVIHMPRYLYSSLAAPLLHRSGFLVTCAFRNFLSFPQGLQLLDYILSRSEHEEKRMCNGIVELRRIEREKSATKEAMEILHEFLSGTKSHDSVGVEPDAKRARTGAYSGSTEQRPLDVNKGQEEPIAPIEKETRAGEGEEQTPRVEVQGTDDDHARRIGLGVGGDSGCGDGESALNCSSAAAIKQQEFRLVKLARNGMVYISIPSHSPGDLVTFFTRTLKDFHTRSRAAPRWCHRIFPVQATCLWTKDDVRSNVVVLVKEFIEGHNISSNNLLKYAVAVNKRGLEEKQKTGEAAASTIPFGKLECIHAVTEAIQSLTPYISVNLTNPQVTLKLLSQMVVILEVLPLVRVETSVCAVSVLPRELVVTKPKLVIQALAPPKKQEKTH